MKRATIIALFLAALFLLAVTLLFRGCSPSGAPAYSGDPYSFQLHAFIPPVTPVPEPATYGAFGVALLVVLILIRKHR